MFVTIFFNQRIIKKYKNKLGLKLFFFRTEIVLLQKKLIEYKKIFLYSIYSYAF